MKFLFYLLIFASVTVGINGCEKVSAKEKIISPAKNDVWIEGKSYTIKWKGFKNGLLCISILVGGKDKGIINSCNTPADKGFYKWQIPTGFISGFGISKDSMVKVVLFYKNNESNNVFSEYFTISK